MSERYGFFVVIEGPSGVGKTTVTALLSKQLTDRGLSVLATKEPSDSRLGILARQGTEDYHGLVLACLVAADRYHHLEHEIRSALCADRIVLCDRYVPTTLVLQQMDGVESTFLWRLNQHADKPDLTIILAGQPARSRARAQQRGTSSRFHQGGTTTGVIEDRLYRDVAYQLTEAGYAVFQHEIEDTSCEAVASALLNVILERLNEYKKMTSTHNQTTDQDAVSSISMASTPSCSFSGG